MNINSPKSVTNSVLQNTMAAQDKRMEQLASGRRVNSAADDAAALQIIERMNAEATAYQRSVRNAFDGISLLQTAEGGMQQIQTDLQRMRELTVQAGNGILTNADRQAIEQEVSGLRDNINRTINTTNFGGINLFNQDSERGFLVGSGRGGEEQRMTVRSVDLRDAGLDALDTLDVSDSSNAIQSIDSMLSTVSGLRAEYGAQQNAFSSAISNLTQTDVNVQAARSRIADLDYAQATADSTRLGILEQANIALRGQANVNAGQVLNLLG
ncbi:MAG: flagellin [Idiomarina sp.]|nr:flagellin [Idiomarina sp.]